jgi:hypothetical protein
LNVDPNGIGDIMVIIVIIIIISRKKDGNIIKFYQMHLLELYRIRLENKTENKEFVCYKLKVHTENRSWIDYSMNK